LTDRARELTTGANVTLLCDDALARTDLLAAHSACWITFSIPEVPSALLDALKDGARLLAPVGPPPPTPQRYFLYKREQGQLVTQELGFPVFFIPDRKTRSNSQSN
jgi:protein-L-isoaspartate O-methyltransferase